MKFRQQAGTRLRRSSAGQKLAKQTSIREVHLMRVLIAAALLATLAAAGPSLAADTPQQTAMKGCAAKWKGVSAADKAKTKYQDYMGTCMKTAGKDTSGAPAMAMKPAASGSMAMTAKPAGGSMAMTAAKPGAMAPAAGGGQAKCKDGVTVTYKNRQGTCSGHGGVATWL
jgi:hypothetical protein